MREGFEYYFKPQKEIRERVFKTGIVAFDTNTLLDFYRVNPETRDDLKTIFVSCESRIWIPNFVANEFYKNRIGVIHRQMQCCTEFNDEIGKLKGKIEQLVEQTRAFPHFSKNEFSQIETAISKFLLKSEADRSSLHRLLSDDTILEFIEACFRGKVGPKLTDQEMKEIELEAKKRFAEKVPPGYADLKEKEKAGKWPYGDYVVWSQLIKHAAKEQRDLVFVTNDNKDDWWDIREGKTLDFRSELREEFTRLTKGLTLEIYTMPGFVETHRNLFETTLNRETISVLEGLHSDQEDDGLREKYLKDVLQDLLEKTDASTPIQEIIWPAWHDLDGPMKWRVRELQSLIATYNDTDAANRGNLLGRIRRKAVSIIKALRDRRLKEVVQHFKF